MSGFFAMGGYAAYIWAAYIVVTVTLAVLWIASHRTLKVREAELERVEAENPRRNRS